jgi:hypothetical protein
MPATKDVYLLAHEAADELHDRINEGEEQYGSAVYELAEKGQFADIWRKIGPLKMALWEGKELPREGPEEICFDLIGHCLLTIAFLRRKKKVGNPSFDVSTKGFSALAKCGVNFEDEERNVRKCNLPQDHVSQGTMHTEVYRMRSHLDG